LTATCVVCAGPIHRRWTLGDHEKQPWLHLHDEDWVDNVHHAVPVKDEQRQPRKTDYKQFYDDWVKDAR
jgi:hypothetical protein